MTHVSELACKPWFLVSTNVCRHYGSSLDLQGPQCRAGVPSSARGAMAGILVFTNVCQHQDGPFVLACLQHLTNTSSAPPQHLPNTSPAPPQHLPSTSPPTQHLGMLRAVKSTLYVGRTYAGSQLTRYDTWHRNALKVKFVFIGQIRCSLGLKESEELRGWGLGIKES